MRLLLDSGAVGVVAEDDGHVVGCGLGAVARLVAAVSTDGDALAERGFRSTGAALFEREVAEAGTPRELSAVGARIVPPGLSTRSNSAARSAGNTSRSVRPRRISGGR